MSKRPPTTHHRFSVLAAALLFSTGGAAIKTCALAGWQVVAWRSGIAAAALVLLLPAARRRWRCRTMVVGIAYATTVILFVLANKNTTAANSIFLQSTAPLYVFLLAPLLLREPLRRSDLPFALLIATGLGLFFIGQEPPAVTAPAPMVGNIMAMVAGPTWGLTLMGLRWLERQHEDSGGEPGAGLAAVVAGNAIAFGIATPIALTFGAEIPSPTDAMVVLYLGTIQIGLAYVFLTFGFKQLRAVEATLLILLEPILNPVWAFLLHGEKPSTWALAGGAVILLTTTSHTLWAGRQNSAIEAAAD